MKRLLFICSIVLLGGFVKAQDFSYLKAIDLKDVSQTAEAAEAALESCCYLTGVRYDKKDIQRQQATAFVKDWLTVVCTHNYFLGGLLEEESELADIYLAFYALNYLNSDKGAKVKELQVEALKGLLVYCSNSTNKIKLSKELKEVEKMIEAGTLETGIDDLDLTSLMK